MASSRNLSNQGGLWWCSGDVQLAARGCLSSCLTRSTRAPARTGIHRSSVLAEGLTGTSGCSEHSGCGASSPPTTARLLAPSESCDAGAVAGVDPLADDSAAVLSQVRRLLRDPVLTKRDRVLCHRAASTAHRGLYQPALGARVREANATRLHLGLHAWTIDDRKLTAKVRRDAQQMVRRLPVSDKQEAVIAALADELHAGSGGSSLLADDPERGQTPWVVLALRRMRRM